MSKDFIKETEDLATAMKASLDVVETLDVKLKHCISGSMSEVDGHSHTIIEESVPTLIDKIFYSTPPPDPGSLFCITDLIETRPGPRRIRRMKLFKDSSTSTVY